MTAGCTSEQAPDRADGIVFEMQTLERTLRDCPENLAPCASIELVFPAIVSAASADARRGIETYVESLLLAPLEEGAADSTAEQLMERFIDGYREFAEEFPEQSSQWVMTRRVEPIYNAGGVFSLEFSEESYTGGAHPNASVVLASLDATTGSRISLDDLFVAGYTDELRTIAERAFRRERHLAGSEDLAGAGFWFEDGTFRLNDNFAVVADGLRFHFNSYEVGPYSMGPTSIVLGTEALAGLIRPAGALAPGDAPVASAPH